MDEQEYILSLTDDEYNDYMNQKDAEVGFNQNTVTEPVIAPEPEPFRELSQDEVLALPDNEYEIYNNY